jgi:hypothetical protein
MARYRFDFWLNADKDDELIVAEKVDELKRKRSFSSVLRDGIMIVSELRDGKTDLLFKLYPWVAEAVKQSAPSAPDNGDLERQIADLKRIILQQGGIAAPPSDYPVMKPPAAPPKVETKAAPVADASTIADNFLMFIQ